jgi:Protein of unknown function (DUF2778)
MTYSSAYHESASHDRRSSSRKASPQALVGNAALVCIALACAYTLYTNVFGPDAKAVAIDLPPVSFVATKSGALKTSVAELDATGALPPAATFNERFLAPSDEFDSRPALAKADKLPVAQPPQVAQIEIPVPQARPEVAPPPPPVQLAEAVPLPTPRPSILNLPDDKGPSRRDVAQANNAVAATPEKKPSIFERLFGKLTEKGPILAFASPDGGVSSDGQSLTPGALYDRETAVYDITARTVYMPDGTKLEAHSGLGDKLDDPRYVNVRMRGATPPHVYDLSLRESLFHGVQAIRLNPVGGEGKVFGRTGLLAHTFMLGPNGDSNGCVSFRNYEAFLRAYKSGTVKKLAVVARLS